MRYTIAKNRDYPWGDFGSILTHGLSRRGDDGIIDLMRCGPFMPPISFPVRCIIVDNATKLAFESSDLTGYIFKPVRKTLIVKLDWRNWDLHADEPQMYPPGGEPEYYILGQRHCEQTALEMGDVWELIATPFGDVHRNGTETTWTSNREPNLDFITPNDPDWTIVVVSEAARSFIENLAPARFRVHDMLTISHE